MSVSTIFKGKKYFDEGRVFPLMNSRHYEIYVIDGTTGTWSVRYDKGKDEYACNCKNVRLTECSHIVAAKLKRGTLNAKNV